MKKVVLLFALIIGLLTSASTAMAQTVNMSRYITLTVKKDSAIKLDFKAAADDIPVRIVSGSTTQDITVSIFWTGRRNYVAGGTTMTVYGDIKGFNCSGNGVNLTAIDPSHNTQLKYLDCSSNPLSSLDVSNNTRLEVLICYQNQLSSLDVSNNTQLERLNCSDNQLSSLDVSNNTQLEFLNCSSNPLTSLDVSHNTQLETLYCRGNNLSTQALDDIFCALPDRTGNTNGVIQPVYNSSSSNHATVLATNKTNATAKNWKVQYNNKTDIPTTTGTYVCGTPHPEPNMNSYITLTVAKDSAIRLDFWAAAAATPIRIVSGSNTQDITVGTSWTGFSSYTADGTTMTVYGDIIGLDCRNNKKNITAINVSHNTQLESLDCSSNQLTTLDISKNTNTKLTTLYCHGNNLSTQALDDIFCALPDRTGNTNGKIQPIFNSSSPNHATVLATNAANATAKNWKVQYYQNDTDIPATTGTYVCGSSPQPNMDSYITLTVANGQAIKLDFRAAAAGTPVRIVSGSNTQDITVGTSWYDGNSPSTYTVTAGASTMTIYGDIINFDCAGNGANITALDLSHNTQLTVLNCRNNSLNSLDISQNTQLEALYCHGNKFTTATLDDIFCALPDRTGNTNGKIQPIFNSSSPNHATVLATNAANATAKNWKVQYYNDDTDIATTGTYVCGSSPQPNMDSYITLTVAKDSAIRLDFKAAAAATPVRIVSGSNTQDITVGTTWYDGHSPSSFTVTAGSTTITIYGDIRWFSCSENGANLTAIDVSKNTQLRLLGCSSNQLSSLDLSKNTELFLLSCNDNKLTSLDISKESKLKELYCYDNNFTTAALDDIYCTLPDRTGNTNGKIQPIFNSSSPNHATVLATNAANATAKNWKVQYSDGNVDITTTGSYVCGSSPQPNMDSYITLTVQKDSAIRLDFKAAAAATPVRIVSGSNTQDITVGTSWTGFSSYTADGTTMTVYGDLTGFDCAKNGENLTALDASNNTQLMELFCGNNNLSSLDVSKNTKLTDLSCFNNKLSNLDLSKNTELFLLSCEDNKLSSLDISKKSKLKELYCYENNFTTATLDDIYCSLPDRTGKSYGMIQPVYNSSSSNHATVLATNAANATAKNWKVQYYKKISDITTTGSYDCSSSAAATAAEPALTLYPNPVADVLYLSATARTIRVYDIYGIEVAHATDTDRVEVSHLPAGIYTVKADGTVAKMVKR